MDALALLSRPSAMKAIVLRAIALLQRSIAIVSTMKRRIVEIPSTVDGIDLAALEQVMLLQDVKACLLTACYQNPLGYSLSSVEKKQIAEMAQQYACPVIEDDVFGEFGYQKKRLLPIKAWDKAGMVIWCSSFSKTLASGYRIGWAVPGQYHWHMSQKLLARNLAVNTPLQLALADFIYCGEYRKHLNKLHVNLSVQMDSLMASVEILFFILFNDKARRWLFSVDTVA